MAAALALLVLLIVAAPAGAATVTMSTQQECLPKSGCYEVHQIVFTAAPGEANDLTVTKAGQDFRFGDAAAPVSAGAGCRADGGHAATCTVRQLLRVLRVELRDGDDRAHAPADATVDGGDGNDAIAGGARGIGGPGDDTLSGSVHHEHDGGPGNDRIVGDGNGGPGDDVIDQTAAGPGRGVATLGPGRDVYLGSARNELVHDGEAAAPERDRIDGGGGADWLSYDVSPVPVTVDLGMPSQAPAHDDVTGIDRVLGSAFADHLTGHAGANAISGNEGDDVIAGGDGDDQLAGGPGADDLSAGDGADFISGDAGPDRIDLGSGDDRLDAGADFFGDRVDCGTGRDTGNADRGDRRAGCERLNVLRPPRVVTAVARARGGRYRIRYAGWCEQWPSCRGRSRLRVRAGGRLRRLPDVRFSGRPSGRLPRSAAFRLPAVARRQLRARGVLTFLVTTFPDPGAGAGVLPAEDRVRLRAAAGKATSHR